MDYVYSEQHRKSNRICYYGDLGEMRALHPGGDIRETLDDILTEIVESWRLRAA
jgi:hypothetical protein